MECPEYELPDIKGRSCVSDIDKEAKQLMIAKFNSEPDWNYYSLDDGSFNSITKTNKLYWKGTAIGGGSLISDLSTPKIAAI